MQCFSKIAIGSAAALCLFLIPQARAEDSKLSAQDRKFMMDAAKGGMMEVHAGQMALKHGSSTATKNYGQRLIDDHSKGNEELMALAKQKGVALPADSGMGPKGLTGKMGADFDREFARLAVSDHQKDIAEFEKEANSGTDPDVKAWAAKMLPTLRAHLDAAKGLTGSMGGQ